MSSSSDSGLNINLVIPAQPDTFIMPLIDRNVDYFHFSLEYSINVTV